MQILKNIQHLIKNSIKTIFRIKKSFLAIILILILGVGYFAYIKMSMTQQEVEQKKVSELVSDVGEFIVLPEEEPVILEVSNPAELSSQQAFFAGVIMGDKVMVYTKAGKAIIWSPSRNKIINVGPIQNDAVQTEKEVNIKSN